MRRTTLLIIVLGLLATAQTTAAVDATGTWEGHGRCKVMREYVKFRTHEPLILKITQVAGNAANVERTHPSFVHQHDVRLWVSTKDPDKFTTASVWCGNDGDIFEGADADALEHVGSCRGTVNSESRSGTLVCQSLYVDGAAAGRCRARYTG